MIPRLWEVNVHSAEKRSTPRPAGAEEIAHAKSAKDGKGGFKIRKAESGIRKTERGTALPCGGGLLELFDGE